MCKRTISFAEKVDIRQRWWQQPQFIRSAIKTNSSAREEAPRKLPKDGAPHSDVHTRPGFSKLASHLFSGNISKGSAVLGCLSTETLMEELDLNLTLHI